MVVQDKQSTSGQQGIKTKYPVTDGLIAGTTKTDGQDSKLEPEQDLTTNQHWGGI